MADVVIAEFGGAVGAVDERVEEIVRRERGHFGVAPRVGVEVQAEDEIGADLRVHHRGAVADFGGAEKEEFALKLDAGGALRVVAAGVGFGGIRGALQEEHGARGFAQSFRSIGRRRAGRAADERDFGSERGELRREEVCDAQRHVAFGHGKRVADLVPALFHLRPIAAEMTGIDRDFHPAERLRGIAAARDFRETSPVTRDRFCGGVVFRKTQRERVAGREIFPDDGGVFADFDQPRGGLLRRVDIFQEAREFGARDRFLIRLQLAPVGHGRE